MRLGGQGGGGSVGPALSRVTQIPAYLGREIAAVRQWIIAISSPAGTRRDLGGHRAPPVVLLVVLLVEQSVGLLVLLLAELGALSLALEIRGRRRDACPRCPRFQARRSKCERPAVEVDSLVERRH